MSHVWLGNELLVKLRKMRMLADDDDDSVVSTGPSKGSGSQQPAWMRILYERSKDWLGQLPAVRIFAVIFVQL
jgi:dynein heavy chain 1